VDILCDLLVAAFMLLAGLCWEAIKILWAPALILLMVVAAAQVAIAIWEGCLSRVEEAKEKRKKKKKKK